MSPPRVLFVDDDASIRRFVTMALEDLGVELVACSSVAEARDALRAAQAGLVLTDLMMPGENGLALLQALHEDAELRGNARIAVFSADAHGAMRAELARFDVWRILTKPVSVGELERCVREALFEPVPSGSMPVTHGDGPDDTVLSAEETQAVERHFGGDRGLFIAFRASCRTQFMHDLHAGNHALRVNDWPSLQLLGHSLKSVFSTLGNEAAGRTARELEDAGQRLDPIAATRCWRSIAETLAKKD